MRYSKRMNATRVLLFILPVLLLLPLGIASAGEARYVELVRLPQLDGQGGGLAGYFNQLYMIAVAIGAILAFIKISIAGVKWSMSDVVTDKSSAREDIKGALLGLAILLIPFIVLNTIYSGLTNLNVFQGAQNVRPPNFPTSGAPGGVSTNPDDIIRQGDVRVGEVRRPCAYTPIQTGTDVNGAPIYGMYDGTTCRQACALISGSTFVETSPTGGECRYYEGTICDPLRGDVCDGGSPIGA